MMLSKNRGLLLRILVSTLIPNLAKAAKSISVKKTCFDFGEPIEIAFTNTGSPSPNIADWIGLVDPHTLNVANVSPQPIMWMWACGDQDCAFTTDGGTIIFGPSNPDEAGTDSWPLDAGDYIVVLTGGSIPYQARALSAQFEVKPQGQSCVVPQQSDQGQQGGNTGSGESNVNETTGSSNGNTEQVTEDTNTGATETTTAAIIPGMSRFVEDAKADIRRIIAFDARLAPKYIRLAFHDCVGGCDGCIDMTNPDNGGLAFAIGSLDAVVSKYESRGISRTDIWMLSSIVASEILQPPDNPIAWPFQWVGRKTCAELNNNDCGTKDGQVMSCEENRGPDRHLPHSDIGTQHMLDFFEKEFGWDARQVTAIMGAHTVGSMRRFNVGFDGEQGWDLTNGVLDNGYFIELVGHPDTFGGSIPDFRQVVVQNSDLQFPDRTQFEAFVNGQKIVMLTADIALARQLDEGGNLRSDGAVLCNFRDFSNRCPEAAATVGHVKNYAQNFGVFLEDYREVMNLMINHGYRQSGLCPLGQVCSLEVA